MMNGRALQVNKSFRLLVVFFVMVSLPVSTVLAQAPDETLNKDMETLSRMNDRFIKNFISQDTMAHNEIIHKDFVCIQSSGQIADRGEYMKGWAAAYQNSGYTSFDYTDEFIRIFGNTALVRSRTIYTRIDNGQTTKGSSLYTDTYIKENGRWWCVQAQITPVK
jgi:hypothetical protein